MKTRTIMAILAAVALQACGNADQASTQDVQPLLASEPDRAPAATVDNPFTDAVDDNMTAVDGAADVDASGVAGMTPAEAGDTAMDATPEILSPAPSDGRSCSDGKRVCGDMESCEDAVFHLEQCGMSRLDGDSDGTPCEKICG